MNSVILQASAFFTLKNRDEKNRDPKIPPDVLQIGKKEIEVIKKRQLLKNENNLPKLKSILIKPENQNKSETKFVTDKIKKFEGSKENQKVESPKSRTIVKVR
uniref:Uncharacterized protein n=1 Tax=Panagrolaimus sp. ES5 TaxID=591445 RepID=A0AC34G3C5_9BILA